MGVHLDVPSCRSSYVDNLCCCVYGTHHACANNDNRDNFTPDNNYHSDGTAFHFNIQAWSN